MFAGRKSFTMDSQNRLLIPSEYRDELGKVIYVGVGFDSSYITVYPEARFDAFVNKLMEDQMLNWDDITTLTSMMSKATADSQGRITLPGDLVKEYDLEKENVIVGGGDHIQIWKTPVWEEYIAAQRKTNMKERFKDKLRNK